jgi:hypothetical protein
MLPEGEEMRGMQQRQQQQRRRRGEVPMEVVAPHRLTLCPAGILASLDEGLLLSCQKVIVM